MLKLSAFQRLATEQNNPRSRRLDRLSPLEIVRLMNREDRHVLNAIAKAQKPLARAIEAIVGSLSQGGRLFFIGAGTSGRLGVIEAAECPPTFNTHPSQIQAFMAGDRPAVFRSKEGSEDNGLDARRRIAKAVRKNDVLVGVAASGVTPFVREGLREGRKRGTRTILVTCNARGSDASFIEERIVLEVGPEVLTGSTRLKSGTACKMALNILTTASMVGLGKVYENWMVDLQPKSRKLVARGQHLLEHLGSVTPAEAQRLFSASGGHVKTAIVMARLNVDRKEAMRRLSANRGFLRNVLKNKEIL